MCPQMSESEHSRETPNENAQVPENQAPEEQVAEQNSSASHWRELAEMLGADPGDTEAVEEPAPAESEESALAARPEEETGVESFTAREREENPPARQAHRPPRPASDWFALATELGIEVEPGPSENQEEAVVAPAPETEREELPEADELESRTPAAEEADGEEEETSGSTTIWRDVDGDEPVAPTQELSDQPPEFTVEEPVPEPAEGEVDEKATDEQQEQEEEDELVVEVSSKRRSRRGRGRRRRSRKREDDTSTADQGTVEAKDQTEAKDFASEVAGSVDDEEATRKSEQAAGEERETKRRRRRRRRPRRTDAREEKSQQSADEPEASGEPVVSPAAAEETPSDDEAIAAEEEDSSEKAAKKAKHRKIPSWEEAVSVIIENNLESRSKKGGSKGKSRGSRKRRN